MLTRCSDTCGEGAVFARYLSMNTRANINWFAASFRRLAVALSIFILLASLSPAHAGPDNAGPERGLVGISFSTANDAQPNLPDGMPGHIAGQCSCSISVLPQSTAQPVLHLVRPVRFALTASPSIVFGAQAPPSEPPRS